MKMRITPNSEPVDIETVSEERDRRTSAARFPYTTKLLYHYALDMIQFSKDQPFLQMIASQRRDEICLKGVDMLTAMSAFRDPIKLNRWLGFVQALMWVIGIRTVDEMRDETRGAVHDELSETAARADARFMKLRAENEELSRRLREAETLRDAFKAACDKKIEELESFRERYVTLVRSKYSSRPEVDRKIREAVIKAVAAERRAPRMKFTFFDKINSSALRVLSDERNREVTVLCRVDRDRFKIRFDDGGESIVHHTWLEPLL